MLLGQEAVLELLCCPVSGVSLEPLDTNVLVAYSTDGTHEYDAVDSYPVLIRFENSILDKSDIQRLSSTVHRQSYGGVFSVAKRLACPPSHVTKGNVELLLDTLLSQQNSARVLIVGGGTVGCGMEPFYTDPRIELVSFDIYASPSVQFLADAHNIPLVSESFDAVIIQAVLEHVLRPEEVVAEAYRVLKIDGLVYAETPFLQHVHEGAYDFKRYTESGHRYLFRCFSLIKSGASAGAGTQLLWALDGFFCGLFRSKIIGKFIKLCLCWLQYFDRLIPEAYNVDAASGVYFLGRKTREAIKDLSIVEYYKGAQR
ncbi:class I SAM-dependent methyltransferase [Enterovibrio norvegicus]|uniref:class I SAM-dependent methyltransferase n=1 Tax=Enterovibrio norvegicus TaxID=188144 RepID=UPI0010BE8374|nr:class I SAM-dependent methyltransferase [Enterovibrio norvegicus]TKF11229.1 class I SAM-dependent methyltransferase [Enterovibrio norvegicus]